MSYRRWVRSGTRLAIIVGAVYLVAYFSRGCDAPVSAPGDGTYTRILARGDGHYFFMGTLSIVYDRDIDMSNQYRAFGDPFGNLGAKQHKGYPWTYPIGASVFQVPLFLVAHAGALVGNAFGADIPWNGYTRWHQRITFLSQVVAGWLAVVLGFLLARRRTSDTVAFYGALLTGLGTGIFFYSTFSAGYGHSFSAFAVALLVWYQDNSRGRHDCRRWLTLGALVGLAALARMQEVLFALLPAVEAVTELARRLTRRDYRSSAFLVANLLAASLAALVVASPQLICNQLIYGSVFATGEAPYFMNWASPFLWEPLFASKNGLYVWTPLSMLATAGLILGVRRDGKTLGPLCLCAFAQVWIAGSAWAWWADAGYSLRRLVDLTAVFILGLAYFIDFLRRLAEQFPRVARHSLLLVVLGPLALMNLELSSAVADGTQKTAQAVSPVSLYTESVRRLLSAIDARVGLPTSWPASLLWALRHRVSPGRYNSVVGTEFLHFNVNDYRVPGKRISERLTIDPGTVGRLGAGNWGNVVTEQGHKCAWARNGARLLVPLSIDDDIHLELSAAGPSSGAETQILVNGVASRFRSESGLFGLLRIEPKNLHPGTNELEFRCDGERPLGTGCLAVEYIDLVYQSHSH